MYLTHRAVLLHVLENVLVRKKLNCHNTTKNKVLLTDRIINCCQDCFWTELYLHLIPIGAFIPFPPTFPILLSPPAPPPLLPPAHPLSPPPPPGRAARLTADTSDVSPEVTSQHRRASQCDPSGTTRCRTATAVGTTFTSDGNLGAAVPAELELPLGVKSPRGDQAAPRDRQ